MRKTYSIVYLMVFSTFISFASESNFDDALKTEIGGGLEQDKLGKVFEHLYYKALDGNASAQFGTAYLILEPFSTNVNYLDNGKLKEEYYALADKAIKFLEKASNQNHGMASSSLGQIYLEGKFVEKNLFKSLKYFQKALTNGEEVFFQIGQVYLNGGNGVDKNESKAFDFFMKGAVDRNVDCMTQVAVSYEHGIGISKDIDLALKWYQGAANEGSELGAYLAGLIYSRKENYTEAFKFFQKAALKDLPQVFYIVASMHYEGVGTTENFSEAYKFFKKGANSGDPKCMFQLARMYFLGQGTVENYVRSYAWLLVAKAKNYEKAEKLISIGKDSMTKEQVAEAQKLAQEFFNSISIN